MDPTDKLDPAGKSQISKVADLKSSLSVQLLGHTIAFTPNKPISQGKQTQILILSISD